MRRCQLAIMPRTGRAARATLDIWFVRGYLEAKKTTSRAPRTSRDSFARHTISLVFVHDERNIIEIAYLRILLYYCLNKMGRKKQNKVYTHFNVFKENNKSTCNLCKKTLNVSTYLLKLFAIFLCNSRTFCVKVVVTQVGIY